VRSLQRSGRGTQILPVAIWPVLQRTRHARNPVRTIHCLRKGCALRGRRRGARKHPVASRAPRGSRLWLGCAAPWRRAAGRRCAPCRGRRQRLHPRPRRRPQTPWRAPSPLRQLERPPRAAWTLSPPADQRRARQAAGPPQAERQQLQAQPAGSGRRRSLAGLRRPPYSPARPPRPGLQRLLWAAPGQARTAKVAGGNSVSSGSPTSTVQASGRRRHVCRPSWCCPAAGGGHQQQPRRLRFLSHAKPRVARRDRLRDSDRAAWPQQPPQKGLGQPGRHPSWAVSQGNLLQAQAKPAPKLSATAIRARTTASSVHQACDSRPHADCKALLCCGAGLGREGNEGHGVSRMVALVVAYACSGSCWAHRMARALDEEGYLLLDAAADAPVSASTEPFQVEPRSGGAVLRRADGCANAAASLSVGVVHAPSQPCVGSGTLKRGCRRRQGRAAGCRARPRRPRLAARSGRPAGAAFAPRRPTASRLNRRSSRVSARACAQVAKAGFGCEAAVVTSGGDGSVGVRLDVFAPARLWCSPGAQPCRHPASKRAGARPHGFPV